MTIACSDLSVNDDEPTPKVVLSYGLGEDSTAILLRWLEDPTSRDFGLNELVVVSAMTGDEWDGTRTVIEERVLPRLTAAGVRFVQVARARRHVSTTGDGVVILDDSRTPTRLYLDGAYTLYDEMVEAGTIPQSGGARICSVHAKGDALDPVIARLTRGRPYRHMMGFEAGERRRADKDAGYNTDLRTGEYPLIEWGWFRGDAIAYTESVIDTGVGKSACTFCPFALRLRLHPFRPGCSCAAPESLSRRCRRSWRHHIGGDAAWRSLGRNHRHAAHADRRVEEGSGAASTRRLPVLTQSRPNEGTRSRSSVRRRSGRRRGYCPGGRRLEGALRHGVLQHPHRAT